MGAFTCPSGYSAQHARGKSDAHRSVRGPRLIVCKAVSLCTCHTRTVLERFSPEFRRYGRGKTKRHSNACLHRVRDRASSLV